MSMKRNIDDSLLNHSKPPTKKESGERAMKDQEQWLILYQAILSSPGGYSIRDSAHKADEALAEYKKRWSEYDDNYEK